MLARTGATSYTVANGHSKPITRAKPAATIRGLDCIHRGAELGTQSCPSCSGSVSLKVFKCDLFAQCTLAKQLPTRPHPMACCATCGKYEPAPPDNCTDADIVIDSDRHGFGDAMLFSWVAEGAKLQGIKIAHYATGKMADLVRCFGQSVTVSLRTDMRNINEAYTREQVAYGKIGALRNRCDWLGIKTPVRPKPLPIPDEVFDLAKSQCKAGRTGPPILFFPQSTRGIRTWPQVYWVVLARQIEMLGFHPIFCVWGVAGEHDKSRRWDTHIATVLHDLSWQNTIALMQLSRAVFGNDSGPVHVSGTLDVPTFVLSGLNTPESREGIPSMHHVAVSKEVCPCVGCYYRSPPRSDLCTLSCMALQLLTPDIVMEQFSKFGIVQ